jgi:hypothetical protein
MRAREDRVRELVIQALEAVEAYDTVDEERLGLRPADAAGPGRADPA